MAERRRFHLGIDYGTSTSKVVFRDYGAPGGERAYPIVRQGTFRIPSSVALSASHLTFGTSAQFQQATVVHRDDTIWYESVKMRVPGETTGDYARYCYGPLTPMPHGFTARDLAVLTVWFLISEGYKAIQKYLGSRHTDIALGMTVGVPMSFFTDSTLRIVFLDIARTAWRLYRTCGVLQGATLELASARKSLDGAYNAIVQGGPVSREEVRNWIRSEAEAALWSPFQSPAFGAGPYAKIDIGAGTTNSSVFRIVGVFRDGRWMKEKLAFFGACSHPVGMDALDQGLARWQSLPEENCLMLRGQEERLLQDGAATNAVSAILTQIHHVYRRAWGIAYPKLRGAYAELRDWDDHNIFVIGGGSLVKAVREAVRLHPLLRDKQLRIRPMEQPTDLEMTDGGGIRREEMPFLTVAYGLSNIGLAIPEAETPDEIPSLPPMTMIRRRLDRDDIYAK